jgi:hypothetical protein
MDESDILPILRRLDGPAGRGLFRGLDPLCLWTSLETGDVRVAKSGLLEKFY